MNMSKKKDHMALRNNGAKKAKGFTLIEILIATAIITIVAAVVAPLLTEVKDKTIIVSQELQMMRTTLANIDDRYWDEAIDTNMDNTELLAGHTIPTAYRSTGTDKIYNLFGGNITITGDDYDGLTWVTENVPANVCTKFVDDAKNLGFENVDVGGNTLQYSASKNSDFTTACSTAAGTADEITITFTRTPSA